MYEIGTTQEYKDIADIVFLQNMELKIKLKTKVPFLGLLRKPKAKIYYWAVSIGGNPAYWAKKKKPQTSSAV